MLKQPAAARKFLEKVDQVMIRGSRGSLAGSFGLRRQHPEVLQAEGTAYQKETVLQRVVYHAHDNQLYSPAPKICSEMAEAAMILMTEDVGR